MHHHGPSVGRAGRLYSDIKTHHDMYLVNISPLLILKKSTKCINSTGRTRPPIKLKTLHVNSIELNFFVLLLSLNKITRCKLKFYIVFTSKLISFCFHDTDSFVILTMINIVGVHHCSFAIFDVVWFSFQFVLCS